MLSSRAEHHHASDLCGFLTERNFRKTIYLGATAFVSCHLCSPISLLSISLYNGVQE